MGTHVRLLIPINDCHSNAKCTWTSMIFNLIKVNILIIHVRTTFVLTLTVHFNIWIFSNFRKVFAYVWLKIWDNLHVPKARWLAYYDLHILAWKFVEVLNCWVYSPLVDHISIALICHVKVFCKDKTWYFLAHLFLQLFYSKNSKG